MSEATSRNLLTSLPLAGLVDGDPALRGSGIIVVEPTHAVAYRPSETGSHVVFEHRHPQARRDGGTSPAAEWISLGFNCGGAALAWIGVAGAGSLAPVTGGTSLLGSALLYGGAVAASGSCAVSVYRVSNATVRHRSDINEAMDHSPDYAAFRWTMRAADVVSLVGAGGALREFSRTGAVLGDNTLTWGRAATDSLSRPMRRRLTEQLELQGAKRVSAANIHAVVKQRMLDSIGAAIGLAGSALSGDVHEVIVWMTTEEAGHGH